MRNDEKVKDIPEGFTAELKPIIYPSKDQYVAFHAQIFLTNSTFQGHCVCRKIDLISL